MEKLEFEKGIISYDYYLENTKEKVNKEYEYVKSILVYVFPYPNIEKQGDYLPSKFAYGKDYHQVVTEFLEEEAKKLKLNKYKVFSDVSFLNEKLCACLSGLGKKGMNDLFISNKYGSFVFIGEIVTDQLFEYNHNKVEDCLKCGKCSIACPNNAIDGKFHKERCLSYLNQRPSENFALYDKMLYYYGCDICQNVCPMNKNRTINKVFDLDEKAKMNLDVLEKIEDYKEYSKSKTYSWIGYLKMLRNILVLETNNKNISIEKLEYYQKKYKNVEWFYNHLEYLKRRLKENGIN